ncbi:hypothetical protein [Microbacterium sp. SORGH_AS_0862]|uniref:phage portal protein family protein n=1 Tax=Microbacterium sp. SORGH_AS_0862 TaxID=3041789 RepID=UPI0027944781|nr:hypothetical protein [Microbacterium sp. SORGH_AS_0862]MDQ1206197.1 hypothetical protein [Microbacterium sp. SORGH_AS_0862]
MAVRDDFDHIKLPRLFARRTQPQALADVAAAPTREDGYVTAPEQFTFWDVLDDEKVPELIWPANIEVYDQMRRTDAQVMSVLRAVMLPIRRTTWRLDPALAPPEVVEFVAANLDLPVLGQDAVARPRTGDRFSWAEHLQLALTCLPFGHSIFEQTYRIAPDANGVQRAWIRKLGWRPPKTIARIDVAPDGGLIAIEQGVAGTSKHRMEVDRLVVYVHEREGGNWLGQSLLRPAYKFWVLKDRMLRIQAQTVDRNGMGVPVVVAPEIPAGVYDPEEYTKRQDAEIKRGLSIAKNFRSGRQAGASIANSGDIKLLGVEGTLPDANKPIRYYDEQIGRSVLANFLNLGGDDSKGSYALGDTFAEFFTLSLQTVALTIADTANKHIVEDLVDLNFGSNVPAPRIVFDEIGSQQRITSAALKELVDAEIIMPDEKLERFARQTYGLPEADTSTSRPNRRASGEGA